MLRSWRQTLTICISIRHDGFPEGGRSGVTSHAAVAHGLRYGRHQPRSPRLSPRWPLEAVAGDIYDITWRRPHAIMPS